MLTFSLRDLKDPLCPGDANGDGLVNFDDLNLVLSNWGNDCT